MAKGNRESFSPPALGGSSLLVVFAVLCLTVFALLSLSTVRADLRLAETSRQAIADYYAADAAAQETLTKLRRGEQVEGVEVVSVEYEDHCEEFYTYAIPVSDTRELRVEVRIDAPDSYEVLRYQVVGTGEWSSGGGLDIWDGEVPF